MSTCKEVVNAILEELAPVNAQFPLLMFSETNCQGVRYPPEGDFNLWGQYLGVPVTTTVAGKPVTTVEVRPETLGMSQIKSIYVPPQSVLELWATGGDGYYSLTGQQLIQDLDAMLAAWRNWDDSPCITGTVNCGNRVVWKVGEGEPIERMRIHNPVPWTAVLANLAANKQTVQLHGTTYAINNDTLYQDICVEGQDSFACECHNAWQELLAVHSAAATQSFVNILQNGCNPLTQFVPSGAPVGDVTTTECQQQINAQLVTGTFPTLSVGGPQLYICAGQTYINAFENGTLDLPSRLDDDEDDDLEAMEMTRNTPGYAYWVMGALLVLGLLMLLFHMLRRSNFSMKVVRQRIRQSKFSKQG